MAIKVVRTATAECLAYTCPMRLPYAFHRHFIWLTALVMLASALAPTLSRWLAQQRHPLLPTMEVCVSRANGPSLIVFKRTSDAPTQSHLLEHCPLCALQADHPGLPPDQPSQLALPALQQVVPTRFLHAPHTSHVWTAAQARAPPFMV